MLAERGHEGAHLGELELAPGLAGGGVQFRAQSLQAVHCLGVEHILQFTRSARVSVARAWNAMLQNTSEPKNQGLSVSLIGRDRDHAGVAKRPKELFEHSRRSGCEFCCSRGKGNGIRRGEWVRQIHHHENSNRANRCGLRRDSVRRLSHPARLDRVLRAGSVTYRRSLSFTRI